MLIHANIAVQRQQTKVKNNIDILNLDEKVQQINMESRGGDYYNFELNN